MSAARPDQKCEGEGCPTDDTSVEEDMNSTSPKYDDSTKQADGPRRRRISNSEDRGTSRVREKSAVLVKLLDDVNEEPEGEVVEVPQIKNVKPKEDANPKEVPKEVANPNEVPKGDANDERKRKNPLPPLVDDPDVRRSLLYDWLSPETKVILEGKRQIPRDPQIDQPRDQQRDQKQVLDRKDDQWDGPTPGENKNQIKTPAHTKIDGVDIYNVHLPVGQSVVDYRWAAMLPGFDGPIAENSHMITSIVLGANEMHPRLLISFNMNPIRNTYEINVFSSKYSNRAHYANNRNIASILNNAFIIIHVDMNSEDKEFINTLKTLCLNNKHDVHFYFIKRSVHGRIIERQDNAYWYYLDAINKHRHLPRVLYTVVRHHCFSGD